MSNKLYIFATLILCLLLVVPSVAQSDIVIDFWHGLTGPDGAYLEHMVNTYNETNADGVFVNMSVFYWDEFFDRWVASVAAGNPPDVVIYHINEMPQYAEAGIVTPIDDFVEAVGVDTAQFSDAVMKMAFWNNQLYGFPLDIHPIAMYYNVDMVEAAGLDPDAPPTGADGLLAWAKLLTVDNDGNGSIDQHGVSLPTDDVMTFRLWWGLIYQNGGSFISPDLSEITVASPEAAEALEFLHDLIYEYGYAPNSQSHPYTDFLAGKVAVVFQGPWWINGLAAAGLNFRTAPVPVIFDEPGVWASSHCFSFSVQDDYEGQLAGMKFANWMTENGALWGLSGQIPASAAARTDEIFTGSDIYQYQAAFVQELDYIFYTPPITTSTEIFAENAPTPLVFGWQSVMLDMATAEDALAEMQPRIQAILDR